MKLDDRFQLVVVIVVITARGGTLVHYRAAAAYLDHRGRGSDRIAVARTDLRAQIDGRERDHGTGKQRARSTTI